MRTIAKQVCSLMAEMHIAMQHLGIAIAILIVMQIVRVNQIDTLVLHFLLEGTLARGSRKDDSQHYDTGYDKQQSFQC